MNNWSGLLLAVCATALFWSGFMFGYDECPSTAVCYYTDKTEKVRWFAEGTPDMACFKPFWYDSYEDVQASWPEEGEVDAWNECLDLQDNIRYCEIHVVRPQYVYGDPAMDDLGHEVFHGFIDTELGDFHQ